MASTDCAPVTRLNMAERPARETVDLSQYPDLVVIHLGMRVNTITGVKTLLGFGPKISSAVVVKPDGLLLHENILYSLRHLGMRQYWRDFQSLGTWSRSEPHRQVVARLFARQRRRWFLARDVRAARRCGCGVHGHEGARRSGEVRAGGNRQRRYVLSAAHSGTDE